jgi:hypothetical protein
MSEHDKKALATFAGEALTGLLASGAYDNKPPEAAAKAAFEIAQKMLDIYREIPRD